ncbi:hypothetical protein [Streptomyces sp. NPDC047000]|uniref:DUF6895 family protein n=1 Tax=Streptomyces sp. NPDC047000 TaxID=3155474 RepID=UPI00340FEA51
MTSTSTAVMPSTSAAAATTAATLERLSAGAVGWLARHVEHFDPFPPGPRPAAHGTATHDTATHGTARTAKAAKAALELALLCHCAAARPGGAPAELDGATALLRKLWQDPEFPGLFAAAPGWAATYALAYAALAPDGIDTALCRAAVTALDPAVLSPAGKSPYQRVELRYYADKAGVPHTVEPYADLLPRSPLAAFRAEPPGAGAAPGHNAPLSVPRAYALTHTAFYLGDFGRTAPVLDDGTRAHALDLTDRMLGHCAEHDLWDLAAELVLTQFVLGEDPARTASGAAAVECLARAQRPDGALPGRSAALRAAEPAEPVAGAGEFFAAAYHTTLVTALMALTVLPGRPSCDRV